MRAVRQQMVVILLSACISGICTSAKSTSVRWVGSPWVVQDGNLISLKIRHIWVDSGPFGLTGASNSVNFINKWSVVHFPSSRRVLNTPHYVGGKLALNISLSVLRSSNGFIYVTSAFQCKRSDCRWIIWKDCSSRSVLIGRKSFPSCTGLFSFLSCVKTWLPSKNIGIGSNVQSRIVTNILYSELWNGVKSGSSQDN